MWEKSYSKTVSDLRAEQVWDVWIDINQWHTWQDDIEYARLQDDFTVGSCFYLKPKGVSEVCIELIEVEKGKHFTDLTQFLGAKMYGRHEFIPLSNGSLEIKTTMSIEGVLSFFWRKVVMEGIINSLEQQTDALIEKARNAERTI